MAREAGNWLDSYLELTDNTEPPEMFRRWVSMVIVAAALQRKCKLLWGSLTFYPNLYVILVGPPGKARKGTAMKVGRHFLEDLGVKMAAESVTREALIQELLSCNNTLMHAELGTMESHSSLTVYSEEFVVFLGHQNYQLMSDLTDWFDCANKWIYRTKHSGTDEIIGVWVNMLGATTPDLIRTALPLDAIGGGLTSRMIFVFEPRKGKVIPFPAWGQEQEVLRKKMLTDLERIYALKGTFTVSKEFIAKWTEWYVYQENHPPFDDPRFAGYVERRPAHVLKCCMVHNAARTDSMILTVEDLEFAINLLQKTEIKMPQAFTGVGRNEHADVLNKVWMEIGLRKKMWVSEIFTKFHSDADERTLDAIIRTLEKMEIIKIYAEGKRAYIQYIGEGKNTMDRSVQASVEGDK